MKKPFLLRYAQKCLSPSRHEIDYDYEYDDSIDMMRWLGSPDKPLAIEAEGLRHPATKKADIEKGEDTKDNHPMWA